MISTLQKYVSRNSRLKRGKIFHAALSPSSSDKILDLGGSDGTHINLIMNNRGNITIADISDDWLKVARERFGYNTQLIDESGKLPFNDEEFDVVFCNSVIEHVTLKKDDIWNFQSTKRFREQSLKRQKEFADEIRRIGKGYFVQTPYRYFLIETHTWLPNFIIFLPRKLQIVTIKFFNKFWPKKTQPDWNLLSKKDMKDLFPDANLYYEKFLGLPKSLIAVKRKGE